MAKTTISIQVDNTILPTAIAALNARSGYSPTVDDGSGNQVANPVTPAQNARQVIITYVRNAITEYQNQQAVAGVTPADATLIS